MKLCGEQDNAKDFIHFDAGDFFYFRNIIYVFENFGQVWDVYYILSKIVPKY